MRTLTYALLWRAAALAAVFALLFGLSLARGADHAGHRPKPPQAPRPPQCPPASPLDCGCRQTGKCPCGDACVCAWCARWWTRTPGGWVRRVPRAAPATTRLAGTPPPPVPLYTPSFSPGLWGSFGGFGGVGGGLFGGC